jgi:uncharacterized protein (DUF433 family)
MPDLDRITFDRRIMNGQACIRGMRIPVALIIDLVAHGKQTSEIIEEYPDLEAEDIRQALAYAAWLAREQVYTGKPAWASRSARWSGCKRRGTMRSTPAM